MSPVGPGLGLGGAGPEKSILASRSLHIDAGKASGAQEYNRFDGFFGESESSLRNRKFPVDGVRGGPYKPGSRRRAGPPRLPQR